MKWFDPDNNPFLIHKLGLGTTDRIGFPVHCHVLPYEGWWQVYPVPFNLHFAASALLPYLRNKQVIALGLGMMKDFLWLIDEGRHWIDLWAAEGITAKTLYADNIGIPPEGLTTLAKACPIDLEWLDTDHWPTDEGIIENTLELGFFWENPGLFPAALGTTVRYCSHDDCYTFIETTVAAVVESLVEHFVLRFAATAAEAEPPPLSPTSRAALMDMAAEGITLENVTVVSPQAWSLSLARGSSNSYVCSTCDVSSERMTISL